MENIKSDKELLGGFKPRLPLVLILSIGLLLGSLTFIFNEVPAFSGAALFVLSALILMTARNALTLVGVICPALIAFMMTGDLALPAIYVGMIFTVGMTVYLSVGGRAWAPIAVGALAYALGAVAIDPITAIPALIPVALGLLASITLPRSGITFGTAMLTILALSAGLALFLANGGSLSDTAELLRTNIASAYASLSSEYLVIDQETAEMLAAYIINVSPGIIFASVSAIFFIALSLSNTLFRACGVGDKIPEEMAKLSLSPFSGIIFLICFFLSAAFLLEGAEWELAAAVTENIIIALALPFTALGFRAMNEYLTQKLMARLRIQSKAFRLFPVVIFILSPSIAFAIFISAGVAYSLKPIYSFLFSKMRSKINK